MQALLVDLYELTMGESYVAQGIDDRPATFQLFCRNLPQGWGYLVAAGIEDALEFLADLQFGDDDLGFLDETGLFSAAFLERLSTLRFSGEVRAMREGTVFFANEPVLELTGPLLEAQLVETALVNVVHFQSLIAARAARCVDAADGRRLVEFGLRRAHGGQAGIEVARASYLAGFDATSDVLAGQRYGIPLAGTMAHSYIECFSSETEAFEAFTQSYPDGSTLLIDTYDTVQGAHRAAEVACKLAATGGRLGGVRLDSGDLLELSRRVREVLDGAGLPGMTVFASGNLDEYEIARLLAAGAPIDGFGVGSRLAVSDGAPSIDLVYKLVDFDGRPVLKLSADKATLPGSKQVWRRLQDGVFSGDLISLADDEAPTDAVALLEPAETGRDSLESARARAMSQRVSLPAEHRTLDAVRYPVEISPGVEALRDRVTSDLHG
jgi:nicotinate phosphoribosyltransferase